MIAKVIVDVPAAQTDRVFDYLVPDKWEDVVQPGIRVIVPFGPRHVQGFVREIAAESEINKLKAIHALQDVTPVLTKELLSLGQWLSEQTLCFQISAFQAMLPAALHAKVKKEIACLAEPETFAPFLSLY